MLEFEDEEEYHEMLEWFDLVSLGSKQVLDEKFVGLRTGAATNTITIRTLKFRGLIGPEWMIKMLINLM